MSENAAKNIYKGYAPGYVVKYLSVIYLTLPAGLNPCFIHYTFYIITGYLDVKGDKNTKRATVCQTVYLSGTCRPHFWCQIRMVLMIVSYASESSPWESDKRV